MALRDRVVTVVGGGVAGLAAALALARRGARVRVLEQAPAITEVGAGLQISPNGAAVLHGLGLGPALADRAPRARAVELCAAEDGARVLRLDLGARGGRYHFLHRADLIDLLAAGARAAGVEVVTGAQVLRALPGPAGTRLEMADGRVLRAGFVVGADGVRSVVRGALNAAEAPVFTGQVAWRALIPEGGADPDAADPVARVFLAPGRHLVSYPLRGGRLRNIAAFEERAAWAEEGWHHTGDPEAFRAAFAGMGGPVPGWLAAVETVHVWGLFRHPVAPVWQGPGCAIIGDAAHPTLPFMAQGANMALEDAWTLAAALDDPEAVGRGGAAMGGAVTGGAAAEAPGTGGDRAGGDAAHSDRADGDGTGGYGVGADGDGTGRDGTGRGGTGQAGSGGDAAVGVGGGDRLALARWQAARAPRCRAIVAAAERNARLYHLSGPLRPLAHAALRIGGAVAPGLALRRFDWIYGHDVTAIAPEGGPRR
ncbi:MAG: FAD-dependent monooxygenase [Alkalilacustris sp.]